MQYALYMSREIKLKSAVTVISGYSFRQALKEDVTGKVFVVQAKNVIPGKPIESNTGLSRVSFEGKTQAASVRDGDVLLVARGSDSGGFKATMVKGDLQNVIVASSVYILRPKIELVSSGYLALYFNSEVGQEALRRIASGSSILTLLMKELQELPVVLPALSTQETLASLYQNITSQLELIIKHETMLRGVLASTTRSIFQP